MKRLKEKISDEDKATIEKNISETTKWVESNENASTDEFEHKQKELESACQPIIMKLYQAGGGPGGAPGGMPDFGGAQGGGAGPSTSTGGSSAGPKVEEVD